MDTRKATQLDLELSAGTMGVFVCFWFMTAWTAVEHTKRHRNPFKSLFICMIWTLLVANAVKTIVGFLALREILQTNDLGTLLAICFSWTFEIHLVMQIILNRLGIIVPNERIIFRLKIIYLVVLSLINVSVFATWIPAIMGKEPYIQINKIWDPLEASLVIAMDAALNIYFIISVKRKLLSFGLVKYKLLIRANVLTMLASLIVDAILIVFMTTVTNLMFSEQFFGLAYLVKARIELQMATLILRVAGQETHFQLDDHSHSPPLHNISLTTSNKQSDTPLTECSVNTSEHV